MTYLKGKKTYIAAGLLVLAGVIIGDMQIILEGLAVAGLRDAINSVK